MAGALIVEGDFDDAPEIAGAAEKSAIESMLRPIALPY
jgi:hypothetical protein